MKISKTKFVAGVQCLKRLYLLVHEPEMASQPGGSNESVIEQGREVGLLARQLFPGGVEVNASGGLEAAIHKTRELVANPECPAIFEGTFEYNDVVVKSDILQRRKENLWRLVEVKSTVDQKEHHSEDLAIQSYVLSQSGLKLASVWLAHINGSYVLTGTTVEPRDLFVFRNLTARTQSLQPELKLRLREQFRILAMPHAPDVPTGAHCINPFVCEFFCHCNRPRPNDYIGYMPRMDASTIEELEKMGIEAVRDIPADFELTEFQRRACNAIQTGEPWFSEHLKNEFESLKYPLYFMDFETVNPAIPRFPGMRPYSHIPFQWSVHVQREPGSPGEHCEFLANDGSDPRHAFIASLCSALDDDGSIIVYNQQFESERLWDLAGWLPEYTQRIKDIQRRLWDLLPVVRNNVYHPAFVGSFSLKAVLPALVPDMTYEGMVVANGQAAGAAWQAMIRTNCNATEHEAKRQALLDYCGQDTLALVRLLEALRSRCTA